MSLFLLRRGLAALLLVFAVTSGALLLAQLAPGDYASAVRPIAASRSRPSATAWVSIVRWREQYIGWLKRTLTLDLGESFQYQRPVLDLVRERAANTAAPRARRAGRRDAARDSERRSSPAAARRDRPRALLRGASLVLLSVPPLISSLVLLTIAARTGWLPVSGMGGPSHFVVPTLALALPFAAMLERLQSQSIGDALNRPSAMAARARGIPDARIVWRHGWRQSLGPILADLRRDHRIAVQRLVRGRDRDVVAGPRRADAARR